VSAAERREPLAFYCMSSDLYFLAAVGMVNSLRLQGHGEPIYVLDLGMTDEQRRLLEPEARVVPAPADVPPFLLKAHAARRHPADVQVLTDVDMIFCAPLDPLLDAAAEGRVVGGATGLDRHREEWSELLGLGPLAELPYLSSALVMLGGELGDEVVRLVDDRAGRVDFERTYFRSDEEDYPLLHAEEDVLNAVVRATASADQVVAFEERLVALPPFAGLRVADEAALRCEYDDGTSPCVVHHWPGKPWLERTHDGVYSRLLRRLLSGDDVAVRVPPALVPHRFRAGPGAWAERKLIDLRERRRAAR
jgi:hypothetical protein